MRHLINTKNLKSLLTLEGFKPSDQIFTNGMMDYLTLIFLINPEENQNVLREANLLKIPVIAFN
jgi:ribosomal protein S2